MTVRRFLAHKNSGKSRLFAVDHDGVDTLEAVTTLGAGDADRVDELVRALDLYLSTRDPDVLEQGLRGLPDAVVLAVRGFLRSRCAPEPGSFGPHGFVEPIRRSRFPLDSRTVEDHLRGAFQIGLGLRVENDVDHRGQRGWAVVILTEHPFVPVNGGRRAWPLPDGSRVDSEWIRGRAPGRQIPDALAVAREAADAGKRARIHTYLKGDGEHWLDGAMTVEVVVDVFAEPPPGG